MIPLYRLDQFKDIKGTYLAPLDLTELNECINEVKPLNIKKPTNSHKVIVGGFPIEMDLPVYIFKSKVNERWGKC